MRYGIVRHKQTVGVFILLCICLSRCHLRCELVGFYRSGISKGNIVQRCIRQRNCAVFVPGVHRAGNVLAGEVKVIGAARCEGKLL